MKTGINITGRCLYCKELITKNGMTRHLATHFKKMEKENEDNRSLYLIVSYNDYFLHLLMDSEEPLRTLDVFLRKIWLECCRHFSRFIVKVPGEDRKEIDEEEVAADVFAEHRKIAYNYDFGGATTILYIELKNSYAFLSEGIELISRNDPLPIMCEACGKPATEIYSFHISYSQNIFFCKACGANLGKKRKDDMEYVKKPLVNSPRTGKCCYTGGTIDTERDGTFKKSKRRKS